MSASALMCMLSSCYKAVDEPENLLDPEEPIDENVLQEIKLVNFTLNPTSETRAMQAVSTNYLLCFDVKDNEVVKIITRGTGAETDILGSAIDDVPLSLTYGDHTLYFVVCANKFDSYNVTDKTVTWNSRTANLSDTWIASVNIKVDKSSSSSRSVSLPRRVAKVRAAINDVIPSDAKSIKMTLSKGAWTYDLKMMAGINGDVIESNVNVTSGIGQSGRSVNLYTFVPQNAFPATSPTSAFNGGNLTLVGYRNDETSYAQYEIQDVAIQENRLTTYSGSFFNASNSATLSVVEAWGEDIIGGTY